MSAQIALACKGLTKRFGGFKAVDDVSLTVREGTIHALIGPNGAGKTTCFNLLTRVLQPDAGRIEYFGRDVTRLQQEAVARLGLVRSFQISAVFLGLSAMQNVRVALMQRAGLGSQFWRPNSAMTHLNDAALRLLADVGLEADADTRAALLPYGRKRALEIAMTLALDPKMLLLDEPMAGLGQEDIARITALIKRVSANRTVLMVEHNLSVVSAISDTITVLARGAILAEGDYQTVSNDERVITAYMGVEHDELEGSQV
ncbi:MAG: ABC transporter ATP-binding protein [Comamonadaceae bacterium]|nr:MAG: ABC transporter ATP-binding protein [Comamonadaceae bacterium]